MTNLIPVNVYFLLQNSSDPNLSDPLVNKGAQHFTYIAAGILMAVVVLAVGLISRKVEHALATALVGSLLFIGFFWLTAR